MADYYVKYGEYPFTVRDTADKQIWFVGWWQIDTSTPITPPASQIITLSTVPSAVQQNIREWESTLTPAQLSALKQGRAAGYSISIDKTSGTVTYWETTLRPKKLGKPTPTDKIKSFLLNYWWLIVIIIVIVVIAVLA